MTAKRTTAPDRAAWGIYARISLDREGNELGIDRQVEDCRKLAKRMGLKGEPVIYADNDISASDRRKKRPDYERLCKDIAARRLSCLLVWHTDRLHRRTAELDPFIDVVQWGCRSTR